MMKPVDLGSPDDRAAADYVREILEQERERSQKSVQPERRRSLLHLLMALVPIALATGAWSAYRVNDVPEPFSPAEVQAAAEFLLYLTAEDLEAFRDSAGALPGSLEEIGLDDEGLRYETLPEGQYRLTALYDGGEISYGSSDDINRLGEAYELFDREAR